MSKSTAFRLISSSMILFTWDIYFQSPAEEWCLQKVVQCYIMTVFNLPSTSANSCRLCLTFFDQCVELKCCGHVGLFGFFLHNCDIHMHMGHTCTQQRRENGHTHELHFNLWDCAQSCYFKVRFFGVFFFQICPLDPYKFQSFCVAVSPASKFHIRWYHNEHLGRVSW